MKLFAAQLDFSAIVEEFGLVRNAPGRVRDAAAHATDRFRGLRTDRRKIPLVTIDPAGTKDLDQALAIDKLRDGYRLFYAIADVGAFVLPDDPVGHWSLSRGQTLYLPDEPARLHPRHLSEGSASLFAGVDRPAVLWTIDLGSDGEVTCVRVERAVVHVRENFSYQEIERRLAYGNCPDQVRLLPEFGRLRRESNLRRHAVTITMPSQRVERDGDGRYHLSVEPRLSCMDDNAELSLLAGMCAGRMMAEAGRGVLRTLGPLREKDVAEFGHQAIALGYDVDIINHPDQLGPFLASVPGTEARGMALMRQALTLVRGAAYREVTAEKPATSSDTHAGVGGFYAHCTAPLRRLVDRYSSEYCLAIAAGKPTPEWVDETIEQVIVTMMASYQLAGAVERACLNLTEATVLKPWVGQNFQAVVLDSAPDKKKSKIFIEDPPVLSTCVGSPKKGHDMLVTLVDADIDKREVVFAWPAD